MTTDTHQRLARRPSLEAPERYDLYEHDLDFEWQRLSPPRRIRDDDQDRFNAIINSARAWRQSHKAMEMAG